MIDIEERVLIGGFASSMFERGFTVALRWLAPELVLTQDAEMSTASDVYSFAMTVLAVSIRQFLGLFLALKWPQLLPR